MAYRFRLSRVPKKFLARVLLSSADWKSLGTVALLAESYAASQRPSLLARSISWSPAGFIFPVLIRASALSLLIFDQTLLSERRVNFWSQNCSLWVCFCPSIHPKQSATSMASSYETDLRLLPFFASCNHSPSDELWFSVSQLAQP